MAAEDWHVAQVNIAVLQAPLDSPQLASFVQSLEPINALADTTPGFVWRLQTDGGDATGVRAFGDDRIIVNLTVWRTIEALADYVFASRHTEVLRRRREWFEPMREAHLALWWIPAGTLPTVEEAERRLGLLREHGPSPEAFTLSERFLAPDATP
jgi:hypothetical protein